MDRMKQLPGRGFQLHAEGDLLAGDSILQIFLASFLIVFLGKLTKMIANGNDI